VSGFAYIIAAPEDDGDILKLLRDNPVPGNIAISYERSPSYFHGCGVMGDFQQTVLVRQRSDGRLAGLGCRAIKRLYVNGVATDVGYLGQLRVDHGFQGRRLVSAGFRYLRNLDRDGRTDGYITTILEGNPVAEAVLVRRPGTSLPLYRQIDRLHTLAITVRPYRPNLRSGIEIGNASPGDLKDIIRFYRCHGPERQFFPVLEEADFKPGSQRIRDLRIGDLLVARKGGRICGVSGLWDQSSYKQPVVRGYSGALCWGRHPYNLYARCRGEQPLPASGQVISLAYAAFTCVAGNDPAIYDRLLRALCSLAAERGYGRLLAGHTEHDPLLAVARRYAHIPYVSRLYTACWKEESRFHDTLDQRVRHIEIATI